MTDAERALDTVARAANELIPRLTERLERHGLGEIEVSSGELRLRVARAVSSAPKADSTDRSPAAVTAQATPASGTPASVGVASPAVGFFVYADGLGPGLAVEKAIPSARSRCSASGTTSGLPVAVRSDTSSPRPAKRW
ncbi:MAG: hypothetical protein H0W17_03475, partial [Chloroflexi bacterium]|nr:hypothetical protein [Chloroflexota bacterium]